MGNGRSRTAILALFAAAALLLAGGTIRTAGDTEGVTDIVFALDISNSMQGGNNFGKVRDRLVEFIQDELDLETNVVVITFGLDARLVARQWSGMTRTRPRWSHNCGR